MSARAKELDPAGSNKKLFGARLRRMRESRGWSLDYLVTKIPMSKSQLARVERGEYLAPEKIPALLDELFGTDELFVQLYALACREAVRDQYQRRMEYEAQAVSIKEYAGTLIPGLLQIDDYALALFAATRPGDRAWHEEQLAVRKQRQARLHGPDAPHLAVLMDEAAIRRPIGGPEVMRRQLEFLVSMVDTPSCVIQLLPYSHGEHSLLGGSLALFTLPEGNSMAYEESIASGTLLEAPAAVQRHMHRWDRLWGCALSPTETAAFMNNVMEALPR
ncbi:Scr1 family TA system antitoxin-like transcriptional regulator [Streptomyces koyangensis]|uniref:helix-turn-helix domain-containing protein n=1 Tax=Streptomyces koyangensis TaxID=188770 RepID=UPI003669653B